MTQYEEMEVKLQEMLSLHEQIKMFAMANLSEDNPFRTMIETQACESIEGLRNALGKGYPPPS